MIDLARVLAGLYGVAGCLLAGAVALGWRDEFGRLHVASAWRSGRRGKAGVACALLLVGALWPALVYYLWRRK